MTQKLVTIIVFVVLTSIFGGCFKEKRPDGMPPLVPVKVKMTQEGKPLVDATVLLVPEDTGSKWHVSGHTDSEGVAAIKTHGSYPGAPEGKYTIVVTKDEAEYAPNSNPPAVSAWYMLVEKKYTSASSSDLKIEITKTSKNKTEEFNVGKAVREKLAGPS